MENTFQINQRANVVFDHLINMQKYASVHPVIKNIVSLDNNQHRIQESLKIGPIRYTFSYILAIVHAERKYKVINMTIVFQKYFRVEIGYRMIPTVDFTIVEETITFKNILEPLRFLVEYRFRKQLEIMFQNINDLPEEDY